MSFSLGDALDKYRSLQKKSQPDFLIAEIFSEKYPTLQRKHINYLHNKIIIKGISTTIKTNILMHKEEYLEEFKKQGIVVHDIL